MTVRDKVLDCLLKAETFVSGEELSEDFGVSRTSVWKAIKKLKEDGFEIESINNKGYKIVNKPSVLSEDLLVHDLSLLGFSKIKLFDTIDSTNLEAKRQADSFNGKGIFISEEQTLGRGRRGKQWVSKKNTGVYMSLVFRPDISPMSASMMTLLAGLSVCKSLKVLYNLEAKIKWPNDLVVNGQKISGTLTEMSSEIDLLNYVVIGTGINVNQQIFPKEIAHMATSIEQAGDKIKVSKHELIVDIVTRLNKYVDIFSEKESLAFVKEDYEANCINTSGELRIEAGTKSFTGIGKGITDLGGLLVEKDSGELVEINSGEVSVRGLYGYV